VVGWGVRALLPHPSDQVDVHSHYATDWRDTGGLRVNFISSVDGAVSVHGLSRGLQTLGDNRVFAALRDLADVVLVGAGTARAEGYGPVHPSERRRRTRREQGFHPQLPIAIVSRSLRMDPTADLFTGAEAGARTVVLTCAAADADVRGALERTADVVLCGDDEVDLVLARSVLAERGLRRILCEGGPTMFTDLMRADVVDELCLTIAPMLAGPGSGRITAGTPLPTAPAPLVLSGLLEEDGALFGRYTLASTHPAVHPS